LSQISHAFDRQTDRDTEFSSLDRVCIACSAVKINQGQWYTCTCRPIGRLGVLETWVFLSRRVNTRFYRAAWNAHTV